MRAPCLYICTTCTGVAGDGARGAADYDAAGEPRPGSRLYGTVRDAASAAHAPVEIHPVTCLANCEQGCSAAIAQPGKWGYLLGRLTPDMAEDVLAYAATYAQSASGTVLRKNRPDSLRNVLMARVPIPRQDTGDEAFLNRTVSP
ncbi:MAG: DUF1636 domain-containing protein [Rhodospirillaceae bacterium]|nr:DUF1636 domain-containing protein [Rhodospirillaceae bacterium]